VDLLTQRIVGRVMQAGNSIGGAIGADGSLVVAQNYTPGGIKAFDAETLELVADVPAEFEPGRLSRVVGLVDLPGRRFAYSLFDADAIWITDLSNPAPRHRKRRTSAASPTTRWSRPTAATTSPACSARTAWPWWTWEESPRRPHPRRLRPGRGRCRSTRCRTCAAGPWPGAAPTCPPSAATRCWWWTPTPGRKWAASPVAGQPVFVMARPDGRGVGELRRARLRPRAGHRHHQKIVRTLEPGKAVLHMEFTPRGDRSGSAPATTTASA
jgi:protein NirF